MNPTAEPLVWRVLVRRDRIDVDAMLCQAIGHQEQRDNGTIAGV